MQAWIRGLSGVLVWAMAVPAAHAGPPLRRNLDSYIFFGLRNVA